MILLTLLLLTLILLTVFTVFMVSTVGAVGIVIFGDVIVCIVFIALLIRYLVKRKNKK